jgi:hypothetical protein
MQTVYMLTALATVNGASGPNGAKKLLQLEVVAPSIRPAGALTTSTLNLASTGGSTAIPTMAVDGRVHNLDGSLALTSDGHPATIMGCSPVAALATDTGSNGVEQALNQVRLNIVNAANASCTLSGGSISPNQCTPALAWVRSKSFSTSSTTSGSNTSGSNTSGSNTSGSGSSGSGDGHSGDGDDGSRTSGSSGVSYTNLDLSAPQLYGLPAGSTQVAPFIGQPGNQSDGTIYQPGATQTVGNEIAAVNNLVSISRGQPNYFTISSASIGTSTSFGTDTNPAVVVITDSTLSLQNNASLSGYGVLVVPNALEVGVGSAGTLKWKGIVLINSSVSAPGHVTIGANAQGSINGALLLAPGATFNLPPGSATALPNFTVSYSCDAIDRPFNALPFRIISSAETSN